MGTDLSQKTWTMESSTDNGNPMESLLEIGRLCQEARRFPAKVEVETASGVFSLSGMELLLLTREAGSN